VGKKSSTKLRKIKKTLQQKRESINAAERKRRELQGEQVSKEALNARKRRNLSYFAIGLNDSGRAIEMDKLLAKQGKKMKTTTIRMIGMKEIYSQTQSSFNSVSLFSY